MKRWNLGGRSREAAADAGNDALESFWRRARRGTESHTQVKEAPIHNNPPTFVIKEFYGTCELRSLLMNCD